MRNKNQKEHDRLRGNKTRDFRKLGIFYRFIPKPNVGKPRAVIFVEDPKLVNALNVLMGIQCKLKTKRN